MEFHDSIINYAIESVLLCFSNLEYVKEYFNHTIYDECLPLTCSLKELITGLNGLNEPTLIRLYLNKLIEKFALIFNDLNNDFINLYFNIISNLIEQLNTEIFSEIAENNLNNESFLNQTDKEIMLGLFFNIISNLIEQLNMEIFSEIPENNLRIFFKSNR